MLSRTLLARSGGVQLPCSSVLGGDCRKPTLGGIVAVTVAFIVAVCELPSVSAATSSI